jgi:hypothetical protein
MASEGIVQEKADFMPLAVVSLESPVCRGFGGKSTIFLLPLRQIG